MKQSFVRFQKCDQSSTELQQPAEWIVFSSDPKTQIVNVWLAAFILVQQKKELRLEVCHLHRSRDASTELIMT